MCDCRAHWQLVDCTCKCDHTGDRMRQWKARAEQAEATMNDQICAIANLEHRLAATEALLTAVEGEASDA